MITNKIDKAGSNPKPSMMAEIFGDIHHVLTSFHDAIPWFETSNAQALKNRVLTEIPFTAKGADIVKNNTFVEDYGDSARIHNPQAGGPGFLENSDIAGDTRTEGSDYKQTLQDRIFGNPALKSFIAIKNDDPKKGIDTGVLAYETFHAIFARTGFDSIQFNKDYQKAISSSDPNAKVMRDLENRFNDPKSASVFKNNSGENVDLSSYQLATERYAGLGLTLGREGLSNIPSSMQKYYKDYINK